MDLGESFPRTLAHSLSDSALVLELESINFGPKIICRKQASTDTRALHVCMPTHSLSPPLPNHHTIMLQQHLGSWNLQLPGTSN